MGNMGSQQPGPEQQWTQSFPRTPQKLNPQKVLPELDIGVHSKLRPTNNGEILFNGGTISGRHHHNLSLPRNDSSKGVHRSSSITTGQPNDFMHSKKSPHIERVTKPMPKINQNLPNGRHRHGRQYDHQKELQMKRFRSVPDLREDDPIAGQMNKETAEQTNKGRKKYKAPPPPGFSLLSNQVHQDSWDTGDNSDTPTRKTRLFKTRAEMKKSQSNTSTQRQSTDSGSSNIDEIKKSIQKSNHLEHIEPKKFTPDVPKRTVPQKGMPGYRMSLAEMQRSKSLPEFQAELHAATQRLRITKYGNIKEAENIKSPDRNIKNTPVVNNSRINEPVNLSRAKILNRKENIGPNMKTLDTNITRKEEVKQKKKQIGNKSTKPNNQENKITMPTTVKKYVPDMSKTKKKLVASMNTSFKMEKPPLNIVKKSDNKEQPSKTFYFGMDTSAQTNIINNNIIDNFTSSFQTQNCIVQSQNYSGSDLSSEIDIEDEQITTNGIALHLRPILPKKQLEIPRFSPSAAWRLLSDLDSNPSPSIVSDEGPVFIEDRIEKCSRQPPLMSLLATGPRSNNDKSGDSGISGDAGPPVFEDRAEPGLVHSNNNVQVSASSYPHNMSWTPQQDLDGEEDSSSDEDLNNNSNRMSHMKSAVPVKFSVGPHVFSLSLPRDNHLAAYMEEKARLSSPTCYTNLQKIKRSVSGVLGNLSNKAKDINQINLSQIQSDNWFLSRSAPNSLNNGFNSLDIQLSKSNTQKVSANIEDEEEIVEEPEEPDFSQFMPLTINSSGNSNGGRVMYLPECGDKLEKCVSNFQKLKNMSIQENISQKNKNKTEELKHNYKTSKMSKSCENISITNADRKSPFEPEDLQDPPQTEVFKWKGHKSKRFTFQSTVRQIERRRIADKLSREAERKEQQRLSELEAMQRVEEEFQRKRAKEKASIRQQLRLFSMDDSAWNNLSGNWDSKNNIPVRLEPDGAASSPSPTLDEVSKYNQSFPQNNAFNIKTNNAKISNESSNQIGENRSSVLNKSITSHQNSNNSDDGIVKAQATQVLSEYRQLQREYKDYRGTPRWDGGENISHNDRQTTIHPKIICNMPRAHGHQGSNTEEATHSTNYRRNFAHGIIVPSKSSGGSTYSEDSQSNGRIHSPRMTQNRRTQQGKCIS